VTSEGILSCVQLPFLRRFDYVSAEARVSKSFVSMILCQNPNLKSLAVNLIDNKSEVVKEIKNRRLTLIDLVIFCFCVIIYLSLILYLLGIIYNVYFSAAARMEPTLIVTLTEELCNVKGKMTSSPSLDATEGIAILLIDITIFNLNCVTIRESI